MQQYNTAQQAKPMTSAYEIATILPVRESFTSAAAGAIALYVHETTTGSTYQPYITVFGRAGDKRRPFDDARFQGVTPSLPFLFGQSGGYARALIAHLEKNPVGLIETHNRVKLFHALDKRFPGTAITMHFHNDPLTMKGAETPKERWQILEKADAIYCCSDFVRRRFLTGLEAGRSDHVHVVYYGVDAPAIMPQKEKVILFVGRMIAEKGVLELAQAARQVLPHFPDWRIAFAGATRPGGKVKASAYAREVGEVVKPLGQQAIFLGHQPHDKIMECFRRSAIAVVPSVWAEPLGRTAMEAMAAGCALVTSGHGGLGEIAGDAGMIVSPVTPQGLALALQGLMEDPAGLAAQQESCFTRGKLFTLAAVRQQLDTVRYTLMKRSQSG